MYNRTLLRLRELEARLTPVAGIPWPDPGHLTLSFAPDGTSVDSQTSSLQSILAGIGPNAEIQVLAAFQQWVDVSNINIGLVSDNGAAYGIGRDVQGDPRFGDIRLGAIPLSGDVGALTAPFNYMSTQSGESVLNANLPFSDNGTAGTYDLETVYVHEAGHALGLDVNQNPASVMYEYYQGVNQALGSADIAAIQGLYGARVSVSNGGSTGGTLSTAAPYTKPITAAINSVSERDVYKFQIGAGTTGVGVQLNVAGLSLLTAKLELLDSQGNVLQSQMATDPTHNNLTINFSNVIPGHTYYVRVSSASPNLFGIGAYQLAITQSSPLGGVLNGTAGLVGATGLNNTLATATTLAGRTVTSTSAAVLPQTQYAVQALFDSPSDVDYYRIAAPSNAGAAGTSLVAVLWGQSGLAVNGWINLLDSQGNAITGRVLVANGNTTIIQWTGFTAGELLYFRVSSLSGTTGNYTFSANFTGADIAIPDGGSGQLTAAAPAVSNGFSLPQTGQIHFVLQTLGTAGSVDLVLLNSAGNTVARITAGAGYGTSQDLYLGTGNYTVEIAETDGTDAAPIPYEFGLVLTTDPIGTKSADTTGSPGQTSTAPSGPSSSASTGSGSAGASPNPNVSWQNSCEASDASWY